MNFAEFGARYPYHLVVIGIVVVAMLGGYFAFKRFARTGTHSVWDCIFIWPLLLSRKKSGGRHEVRDFTKRELIGWGVVIALGTAAVVFGL